MKKIFLFLFSFAFIFCAKGVFAEASSVWECNGVGYSTFDDAVTAGTASSSECTVKLLSDQVLSSQLVLNYSSKTITLDLNGHGMNSSGYISDGMIHVNAGNLIVKNSGSTGIITTSGSTIAIFVSNGCTVTLSQGAVISEIAQSAVFTRGVFILDGGIIEGCSTPTIPGAAIRTSASGVVNILNGTIRECSAINSYGGGIFLIDGATLNMSGGAIETCTAQSGGGICVGQAATGGCHVSITGGTIRNCSATSMGGGMIVGSNNTVNITGGTITNCNAGTGGGIFTSNSESLNVSGTAVINENTCNSTQPSNIYCNSDGTDVPYIGSTAQSVNAVVSKDVVENAIDNAVLNGNVCELFGITTLSLNEMKCLKDHPDVTLILNYVYEGVSYRVEMPGANVFVDPEISYYGPLYLNGMYGPNGRATVSKSGAFGDVYVIKSGDTLSKIAKKLNMKLKQLLALNENLLNPDVIVAGDKLRIQ